MCWFPISIFAGEHEHDWLVVWNMNFIFPYFGNFIIPTDELIFLRGVGQPPTSTWRLQGFGHKVMLVEASFAGWSSLWIPAFAGEFLERSQISIVAMVTFNFAIFLPVFRFLFVVESFLSKSLYSSSFPTIFQVPLPSRKMNWISSRTWKSPRHHLKVQWIWDSWLCILKIPWNLHVYQAGARQPPSPPPAPVRWRATAGMRSRLQAVERAPGKTWEFYGISNGFWWDFDGIWWDLGGVLMDFIGILVGF